MQSPKPTSTRNPQLLGFCVLSVFSIIAPAITILNTETTAHKQTSGDAFSLRLMFIGKFADNLLPRRLPEKGNATEPKPATSSASSLSVTRGSSASQSQSENESRMAPEKSPARSSQELLIRSNGSQTAARATSIFTLLQPNLGNSHGFTVSHLRSLQQNGSMFRATNPSILSVKDKFAVVSTYTNSGPQCVSRLKKSRAASKRRPGDRMTTRLARCLIPIGSSDLDCSLQIENADISVPSLSNLHEGVFDLRLFSHDGDVWGIGTAFVDRSNRTLQQPVLVHLNLHTLDPIKYLPVELPHPDMSHKDWVAVAAPTVPGLAHTITTTTPANLPVSSSGTVTTQNLDRVVTVMTNLQPLTLSNVSLVDGKVFGSISLPHSKVFSAQYAPSLRLSTGLIPWSRADSDSDSDSDPDPGRLLLGVARFRAAKSFLHVLVLHESRYPYHAVTRSEPFHFTETGLRPGLPDERKRVNQFAAGIAYFDEAKTQVVISLGVDECHSVLSVFPKAELDQLLLHPSQFL